MKKYILLLVVGLIAISVNAQKKETRNVEDFSYISFGVSGDLEIRQGSTTELVLEGDPDDLKEIETYVTGGKLKIKHESNWSWINRIGKIKAYVTVKEFDGVSVSGSGDAVSVGKLKGDNVNISVSGSGDIDLELEAEDVDCGISGSGSIALNGKGNNVSLSVSGSGSMDAVDFESEVVIIRISGSGNASIWATHEIDSKISGSGSVRYKGDPDKVSNRSSGSGKLRKL